MLNRSLTHTVCLTMITFFSTSPTHANLISKTELDLVIKEDIAAAQVLNEVCPALVKDPSKIQNAVAQFTQESLKELSTGTISLEQLKQDADYQAAYQEALSENNQYTLDVKTQGCNELISAE